MQDLIARRDEILDELSKEVGLMRSSGQQLAENEAKYRMRIRTETLLERSEGTPATLVRDLVRGIREVAELKQQAMCSEALYKSSQEKINVLKLELRTVEADIQREWNSGGYQ